MSIVELLTALNRVLYFMSILFNKNMKCQSGSNGVKKDISVWNQTFLLFVQALMKLILCAFWVHVEM